MKPGPKSDVDEKSRWAAVLKIIQSNSGLVAGRLEALFGVGDGGGRVWRSWTSATKLPRQETRELVVKIAHERGWLIVHPFLLRSLKISDSSDTNLQLFDAEKLTFELPTPAEYPQLHNSKRQAAGALIRDALSNKKIETTSSQREEWRSTAATWNHAVEETRKLLDRYLSKGVDEVSAAAIIKSKILAAYQG